MNHPKSQNPKNLAANKRVKLALLPSTGVIHGAIACMLGAEKYGAYNWRKEPIGVMEYIHAIMRHAYKFADGEDYEEGAHHLGNIIACAAIVLDAMESKKAIDDRPVKGPAAELLKKLSEDTHEAPKDNPYAYDPNPIDELQRAADRLKPVQRPDTNGRAVG